MPGVFFFFFFPWIIGSSTSLVPSSATAGGDPVGAVALRRWSGSSTQMIWKLWVWWRREERHSHGLCDASSASSTEWIELRWLLLWVVRQKGKAACGLDRGPLQGRTGGCQRVCGRLGEARLRSHGLTVGKAFSGAIVSVVGSDRSPKG